MARSAHRAAPTKLKSIVPDKNAKPFSQVLEDEKAEIVLSRARRNHSANGSSIGRESQQQSNGGCGENDESQKDPDERQPIPSEAEEQTGASDLSFLGLSFSGGGIRSATFNLGVLQALAKYGLIPRIDYLSTVSGGGYIGSWLTSWIRRDGLSKVVRGLAAAAGSRGAGEAEARQISFLRQYSNYLTPQTGFLSADTWAMLAIYLRNLLLNLTILTALFAAFLLFPRLLLTWDNRLRDVDDNPWSTATRM